MDMSLLFGGFGRDFGHRDLSKKARVVPSVNSS
ncbi:MAG: hypothetical protein CM15mP120_20080 [Pseudomonadota bacterium]|nr:MAG: hypothetical protein CM15mP120_20080 [Pseudomonadota bacterium]